jgi:hypothetical protein
MRSVNRTPNEQDATDVAGEAVEHRSLERRISAQARLVGNSTAGSSSSNAFSKENYQATYQDEAPAFWMVHVRAH